MRQQDSRSSFDRPGERAADRIAAIIVKNPWRVLVFAALMATVAAWYAASHLVLDADTNHLIGADRPFMIQFNEWLEEFGDLEYLYVVVDPGDTPAAGDAAVKDLVERLRAIPELPAVHGWISGDEQWRLATRAMPLSDLEALVEAGEGLAILSGDASATAVLRSGTERLERVTGLSSLTLDDSERRSLAASGVLLLESIAAARLDDVPRLRGDSGFDLAEVRADEFLVNPGGRFRFIEILPRKDFGSLAAIEAPLAGIRSAMARVEELHPGVEIGITGKPVLQADELAISDADMTRCATGAFAVIAVLFMVVFRDVRRPLLAMLAFLFAFAWTYGAAALLVGRLNLLSIVFMLVLVGVGLDYGIHMVARWAEARRRSTADAAVGETIRTAGIGNFVGAITSAGVFFLALCTDFGGLRELGIIAGTGLLLCVLAMGVVLPAMLVLLERRGAGPDLRSSIIAGGDPRESPAGRRSPLGILALGTLISGIFVFTIPAGFRFEENLLALQADGLESVEWEHRVLADSSSASWFAAVVVDSESEIEAVSERASNHPEIGEIRSVLDLVVPASPERDRARASFRSFIPTDDVPLPEVGDAEAVTPAMLEEARDRLQTLARSAEPVAPDAAIRLRNIAERLGSLASAIEPNPERAEITEDPGRVHAAIDRSRKVTGDSIRAMQAGESATLRDALPAALRARLMSPAGRFQIELVPARNIWESEPMARFIEAVRDVDPDATGVPITQFESLGDMRRAFLLMGGLSLLLVTSLVWIDFRSLRRTLMVMTVLLIGLLWTIGATSMLGVSFNVANFFAIPILIGIGVDSAIHMMHRADECGDGPLEFRSTRRAVILTALTTGIGFGSLMFARHLGLQSLGVVMAIGSVTCMLSSVVLLPALIRIGR
ncbi:MAG: MMPL family transporter [Phycisphaerales bacterium]|nr:MMPL family transporter [Phycisphaerales bacterium]